MLKIPLISLTIAFALMASTDFMLRQAKETPKDKDDNKDSPIKCKYGKYSETAIIFNSQTKENLIRGKGNVYDIEGNIYGINVTKEDHSNIEGNPRIIRVSDKDCVVIYSDGKTSMTYPIDKPELTLNL